MAIRYIKEYASFGVDVDITGDGPPHPSHVRGPVPTVVVVTAGGGGLVLGTEQLGNITLTALQAGDRFQILGLTTIRSSGTSVGRVRLEW